MKIAVVPDAQVKPGVDLTYLEHIGMYLAEKRPEVIVNIGDFADMSSLSSYDQGRKQMEGRRYKADIEASKEGMDRLLDPIRKLNERAKRDHRPRYNPRMIMCLGNHCYRIQRAIDSDPKLEGTISLEDLGYKEAGWEVHDFLEVVTVSGVAFSHYFTSGVMGRPVASAQALLSKKHMSAVMGHVQERQIAYATRADGKRMTGLFVGCCAPHYEEYLGPQGNTFWKGLWILHEVDDGQFDELPVSLEYLKKRYT